MSALDYLNEQQFGVAAQTSREVGDAFHALGNMTKEGSHRSERLHGAGDRAYKASKAAKNMGIVVKAATPLIKFAAKALEDTAEG